MGQLGRRGSTPGEENQRGVPAPPRTEERESTLREAEGSSRTGPLEGHVLTTLRPAASLRDTRPCLKGQAAHADRTSYMALELPPLHPVGEGHSHLGLWGRQTHDTQQGTGEPDSHVYSQLRAGGHHSACTVTQMLHSRAG